MNDGKKQISREKFEEKQKELDYRKGEKRQEILNRKAFARSLGDLSENSELDQANSDQVENEAKIAELEEFLATAIIYDESNLSTDKVQLGNFVTVLCMWNNKVIDYQIVGSAEADPFNQKISNVSPVGQALVGKEVGDVVEVQVPSGTRQYKITDIRLPE